MPRKNKSRKAQSNSLDFQSLQPRQLLAADVSVGWQDLHSQPLLGETVEVSINVSNTGDDTGFGPFVDIVVPGTGLSYVGNSGSWLDTPLKETIVQFDEDGVAEHPFVKDSSGNPLYIAANPNDQLVVFEFPIGSYVPDQPAMEIDMQLAIDALAEAGAPLQLTATGGLRYGNDALDLSLIHI